MSAFEVDDTHLDVLLTVGLVRHPYGHLSWNVPGTNPPVQGFLTEHTADQVGAILRAENRRSVNHRYDENELETVYVFRQLPRRPSPVVALKALSCYEYQSCEHPGWPASEAAAFCTALRLRLIGQLPGYDDALWHIGDHDRGMFGGEVAA